MELNILAFGIAREIAGSHAIRIEVEEGTTVADLKAALEERFPQLRALASLLIAQDADMADPDDLLRPGSEIALIPPVSGG